MIRAAINPETGEFMGLILPKEDLDGSTLTVFGTAGAWQRLTQGEKVDPDEAGVIVSPGRVEALLVDNLCPPGKAG